MEVCNVFFNNLNTFCKEFYTCTCKMALVNGGFSPHSPEPFYKEIVLFGVKIGVVKPLQSIKL